jgi:hypothetical protein
MTALQRSLGSGNWISWRGSTLRAKEHTAADLVRREISLINSNAARLGTCAGQVKGHWLVRQRGVESAGKPLSTRLATLSFFVGQKRQIRQNRGWPAILKALPESEKPLIFKRLQTKVLMGVTLLFSAYRRWTIRFCLDTLLICAIMARKRFPHTTIAGSEALTCPSLLLKNDRLITHACIKHRYSRPPRSRKVICGSEVIINTCC